jgi:hypothetical protein
MLSFRHCSVKKVLHVELTRISWNPNMHVISEAVRSSMNISGLSIEFSSSAYLRSHKSVLVLSRVRVPGCRSRGPGSIPGASRFSEKWWVWNGVHSTS